MASFRGHLTFSTSLGLAYGGFAGWQLGVDWGTAILAGELVALGGLLPDLDSDSGIPVRELFGMAAALAPILLIGRLQREGIPVEQMLVILSGVYLLIRYGLSEVFKRFTVHRGMYHSIPAMVNSGLIVFLAYHDPDVRRRGLMAAATMLGFLSHLVLDELCSVDLQGAVPHLNKFAGSALKLGSPSLGATIGTYALLVGLGGFAAMEVEGASKEIRALHQKAVRLWQKDAIIAKEATRP